MFNLFVKYLIVYVKKDCVPARYISYRESKRKSQVNLTHEHVCEISFNHSDPARWY